MTGPTKFTFESNASIWLAQIRNANDGGRCYVFMPHPGGFPMFGIGDPTLPGPTSRVDNAPDISTFAQFRAFVTERWADLATDG